MTIKEYKTPKLIKRKSVMVRKTKKELNSKEGRKIRNIEQTGLKEST